VVVMRREVRPAPDALGDPVLVQHERVRRVGDAQIEQCRRP
jgi:hypothetical protein